MEHHLRFLFQCICFPSDRKNILNTFIIIIILHPLLNQYYCIHFEYILKQHNICHSSTLRFKSQCSQYPPIRKKKWRSFDPHISFIDQNIYSFYIKHNIFFVLQTFIKKSRISNLHFLHLSDLHKFII